MRGIGKQRLLRCDQRLDALRGTVETSCQMRDFILSFDRDTGRQLAGAECIDARLQPFQAARKTAHDRIGADADGNRDHTECSEKSEWQLTRRPRPHPFADQPATVWQFERKYRGTSAQPTTVNLRRVERWQFTPDRGNAATVGAIQREIRMHASAPALQRLALRLVRRGRRR